MALRRGNFIVTCDEERCTNYMDLETVDFDDAKELKADMTDYGWENTRTSDGWKDFCPEHARR